MEFGPVVSAAARERIVAAITYGVEESTEAVLDGRTPEYLPRLRQICDRHGVLLIVDEVITGFGRTLNSLLRDKGLLTRATHIIMLSPPLCITRAEVDRLVEIIDSSLTALERQYGYC